MMKTLLYSNGEWEQGTCDVCGRDVQVVRFMTDRKMVFKVEFQFMLCNECALYTAGALLKAWGYVPS